MCLRPFLLAAAVLVLAAVAGFWIHSRRTTRLSGRAQKAIAVLYFSNLSQDHSLNWLDTGLTDMLTTNLAQVKGLDVLSTERVMSAVQHASKDGKSLDPGQAQQVARDAGADAYIASCNSRIASLVKKRRPQFALAYMHLSGQYFVQGDLRRSTESTIKADQLQSRGGSAAQSFAQQQKLDAEELQTVAFLQAMAGNTSAAEQTLQRFASSHPWVSTRYVEVQKVLYDMSAAVERKDGQAALTRGASIPNFQFPILLFLKGRAHLLINDYSSAETDFRRTLSEDRLLSNATDMTRRFPALEILSLYYLGEVYERGGKRDQAINEYQEFLSRFAGSSTRLPQIREARTALQRLMP
jgi:tetratricopeptide (TPR) repeat protein